MLDYIHFKASFFIFLKLFFIKPFISVVGPQPRALEKSFPVPKATIPMGISYKFILNLSYFFYKILDKYIQMILYYKYIYFYIKEINKLFTKTSATHITVPSPPHVIA